MEVYGTRNRKVAASRGSALKRRPEVKEYIEKMLQEAEKKAKVDAQRVLELLAAIAFTSPADFASITQVDGKQRIVWQDVNTLPDEVKSAIAIIKNTPSGIAIETLDRLKAIDLLMKYMGFDKKNASPVVFEGEEDIEQ